jgi:anaerobic magnesium-protoporphyrin IX monomethyl ester cyclase
MKVLLINPPDFNEITTQVSRYISEEASLQPPLGLMYIAAVIRENGFNDVEIIDSQAEKISYGQLEERVSKSKPDVVGMHSMTFTMTDVMITAKIVKKVSPECQIVVGGAHVDIYPNETIKLPEIDYVIKKEGEFPFLDLITKIDNGKLDELTSVRNLVWINGDGEVVTNQEADKANDYSLMPFPARDLVPVEKYFSIATDNNPVTSLMTAKGCPFSCTFCYNPVRKVYYRTSESIVNEMEEIKGMGIKEIFFVDDTFYVNSKRAMAICDEIIRRKLDIPWGARARANTISHEMLSKFKKAGCVRLHIGVESGNNDILNILNKKITAEKIKEAFKLCRKHKITTMAYFIIGNPGETIEEVEESIRFAKKINPSFVQFSRMTPFPDTVLYTEALEKGVVSHDYWLEYAKDPSAPVSPQFWTENFTQDELADLADYATQKFYIRPYYILSSILKLRSFNDLFRKARIGFSMMMRGKSYNPFKLKMS